MRIVLVFLFALFVLALLLLYRSRRYLKLIHQFLQSVRHFQTVASRETPARSESHKLIQCGSCGTWIPESRAVAANFGEYCSNDCLKRAEMTGRRKTAV